MYPPSASARSWLVAGVVAAAVAAAPAHAAADDPPPPDYFAQQPAPGELKFRESRHRPRGQVALIAGLAGGALLAGGLGLWFHLDSRDAADEVSAIGELTGRAWTADRQEVYDRA